MAIYKANTTCSSIHLIYYIKNWGPLDMLYPEEISVSCNNKLGMLRG